MISASLLEFLEQHLDVPQFARAWSGSNVSPGFALRHAHLQHLLWLARCCNSTSQEIARVLGAAIFAQSVAAAADAEFSAFPASGISPELTSMRHEALLAQRGLRHALEESSWWQCLCLAWERWYTRGHEVRTYPIRSADGQTVLVRGTAVGAYAVREVPRVELVRVPPASLPSRRHADSIEGIYLVDQTETGYCLGTFASGAVAFAVAARFNALLERHDGADIESTLWKAVSRYRGTWISTKWESWPARPTNRIRP